MNTAMPFVVISSCVLGNPGTRYSDRGLQQRLETNGFSAYPVTGSWEGTLEDSWLVPLRDPGRESTLLDIAAEWSQDCILLVGANHEAVLVYTDGHRESIGKWRQVSEETAKKSLGWTLVRNKYYVCS